MEVIVSGANCPVGSTTFEANLAVLKQRFPRVYKMVEHYEPVLSGEITMNADGHVNLRYLLENGANFLAYNEENPWLSAAVHLNSVPQHASSVVVFIGMGLGYGPLLLMKERPHLVKLAIVEPSLDMFSLAIRCLDLTELFQHPYLHLYVKDIDTNLMELELSRDVSISDTHILKHSPSFTWNSKLYETTTQQVYLLLNKINAMGGTTKAYGKVFIKNRLQNLTTIRFATNSDVLKGLFKDIPALLVAAGPSLDMSIPDIQKAVGRCVIFAVDSALPTLLKNGIMPDFISALDMEAANFEKFAPFLTEDLNANLAVTIKVSPLIPKRFPAKRIFYAFNPDIPHMWMIKELGIRNLLPPLLSVAHLSVALARLMEASPIVLVGQDLAYTKAVGSDHASGVIFHENGLPKDREIIYVKSITGEDVPTDRGLLSIKQQMEEIVAESEVPIINATAMGVHIEGTEVMPLSEVLNRFMTKEVHVQQTLDKTVSVNKSWQNRMILQYVRRILHIGEEVLVKVKRCKKMLENANEQLNTISRKKIIVRSLNDLPAKLRDELIEVDRLNNQTDDYDELWNQVLELTYDMLKENDNWRRKNEIVKAEQGYLPWLREELNRLHAVQIKRIDVLSDYFQSLRALLHRLDEEDRLLKLIAKGKADEVSLQHKLDLARLYVDFDDLQAALSVLKELVQEQPESAQVQMLMGYVMAGLLSFEEADRHFERAQALSPDLTQEIVKMREKSAALWLQLIRQREYVAQPDGEYLLWGEKYPHLLRVWLERIQRLNVQEAITEIVQDIWPQYARSIERYLQEDSSEKAMALLQAWNMPDLFSKNALANHAFLSVKAFYEQEHWENIEQVLPIALQEAEGDGKKMAFLARVFMETGKLQDGIDLLVRAVALYPEAANLWEELGDALMDSHDYEGAIAAYEQCLLALSHRIELLKKMGDCYLELGQAEAAKVAYEAFKSKLQQQSQFEQAERLFQEGLSLQKDKRYQDAIDRYKDALNLVPSHITAWMNMGVAYSSLKMYQEAEEAFRNGLKYDEQNVDLLYNLACLYFDLNYINEAQALLERVLKLQPDYASAYNNLGYIYKEYKKDYEAAINFFNNALKLQKNDNKLEHARIYYNLANCYQDLLNISKAIEFYRKAIAIDSELVEAHWNLSHVLLLSDRIEEGFKEYLWRWRRKEAIPQDPVPIPRWQGEPDAGRILVWTEQGAGDNIQFVRYLSLLKAQGKKVVLACDASVSGLFHGMKAIDLLVLKSHLPVVCSEMDYHVPLLNLPTFLQKENEPFPHASGYLAVDEGLFHKFNGLFEAYKDRLKVGFVWQGNPKHNRDKDRSVNFEMFQQLFPLPDTVWFSLQYQTEPLPFNSSNLVNLSPYLFDFAHTAAIVSHLDLVITVDTSVAHLAGAVLPPKGMKRPNVWTLLAYVPDWRWGLNRDVTPWYDNMRLFRQNKRGDWQEVFDSLKEMLKKI